MNGGAGRAASGGAQVAEAGPRGSGGPWRLPVLAMGLLVAKQLLAMLLLRKLPGPLAPVGLVATAALLALPPLLLRGRARVLGLLAADALLTFVLVSDVVYFRQFSDLTSVAGLRFAGQLGTVSASVLELLRPVDALFLFELPWLVFALARPDRFAWLDAPAPRRSLVAGALLGALALAVLPQVDPRRAQRYLGNTQLAQRLGPFTYHLVDLGRYLERVLRRREATAEELAQVRGWLTERRAADVGGITRGIARGRGVIVLQVESLHDYPLGLVVRGQEITPNLNRLARESVRFENLFHQTAQGVTSDADLLGNCSLLPASAGAVYYDFADREYRCVPRLLADRGYATVAMQGLRADFWNLAAMYPRLGFQRFLHEGELTIDEKVGIGLSDRSFLRQAAERIAVLPRPFYAFLVTISSHGPFNFADLPRSLELGPFEGDTPGDYLHAVHYTDRAIGAFVEDLRRRGILDEVVLVLYGDHNAVYRGPQMSEITGIPLSDEVRWFQAERRVAAMIRLPGGAHAGPRAEPAGQLDLGPTLLRLLDVPLEGTVLLGRDLLGSAPRPVVMPGGAAVDAERIWLPPSRCLDLASGTERPAAACADLASAVSRDNEISALVLERNLAPVLTAAPRSGSDAGASPRVAGPH